MPRILGRDVAVICRSKTPLEFPRGQSMRSFIANGPSRLPCRSFPADPRRGLPRPRNLRQGPGVRRHQPIVNLPPLQSGRKRRAIGGVPPSQRLQGHHPPPSRLGLPPRLRRLRRPATRPVDGRGTADLDTTLPYSSNIAATAPTKSGPREARQGSLADTAQTRDKWRS